MTELFTRLTFNENDWIVPSGHPWKKSNQGKTNIPYENQYGFGHEEWIFNTRYYVESFQYGYIRGLRRFHAHDNKVDRVHLYTVQKEAQQKLIYYLGFINDVHLLDDDWETTFPKVAKVYNEYSESVKEEVEKSKGDKAGLSKDEFIPVVRFKVENAFLYDEPILVKNFPLERYKRFQPYRITNEILDIFSFVKIEKSGLPFKFTAGKANQTERYNRYSSSSEKSIIKTHSKIVDRLEEFLKPAYSLKKENISIEKTRFKGNIADIVTIETDRSISIYEVKTNVIARRNIREALAQLLDYASHSENVKINKLFIVSPCRIEEDDIAFLKELKRVIKHSISYISFNDEVKPSFIIYE
jgi:hypothetical protein